MENKIIVEEGETILSDEKIEQLVLKITEAKINTEKEYDFDIMYFLDSPYLSFYSNENIPKEYIDSIKDFHKTKGE